MRAMVLGMGILLAASTVAAQGKSGLDELAASTGKDAAALVTLGDLYVEAMRLDEAKKAYRGALKVDKKHGDAETGLVRIKMARNKFKPAKQACRAVARKYKETSAGEICSGWFWLSNDRSARALDEFTKAIEKGDVARGKTGMGEALRRQGEYDQAIEAYRTALGAGAGYVAHLGLGLALEANGDKEGAVASLEKAVGVQPASCESNYHLGRLLPPGAKAADLVKAALAIRPGWVEAQIALGNVYLGQKNSAEAAKAFEAAVGEKTGRGEANFGLGQALHTMGKNPEALAALNKTIEAIPNHVGAYLLIADIQYAAGSNQDAIEALDQARNVAPGDVKVYLHSGDIYFRMGRHTSARSFLNQATSMDSKASRAHFLLGTISCERRLYDEGKSHLKRALKGDMDGVTRAEIDKAMKACKKKPNKKTKK